ncbi:MAG: serine/threonine protein kinase [Deltaproteobacteria bacterium]|nr:serine/threonine protein kinase [Deltaproteobacteria bacterium]
MPEAGKALDVCDEPRDSLVGLTIGDRYEVTRRLGRGGMGIVYEARHVLLGKAVAVKVLKTEHGRDEHALVRFQREAQSAASIGNDHIVDVTDFGATPAGEPYIVMELLDGQDLAHLLAKTGPLPVGRALGIARQLARALEAAHAKGIIHRDLKSENVFLVDRDGKDFVKLLDFGISKIHEAGQDPHLTGTGVLLGTPRYMAPEQAKGEPDLDRRVDVYSLGVILYEMVTGRVPFLGRTSLEIVHKHVNVLPEPPRMLRPDLPEEVERVILHALEKDRDARPSSAAELLAALPTPEGYEGAERAWPLTQGPVAGSDSGARSSGTGSGRRTVPAPARSRSGALRVLGFLLVLGIAGYVVSALLPFSPTRPQSPRVVERVVEKRVVEERVVEVPSTPAVRRVRIEIATSPGDARVFLGEELQGTGHVVIEAPRSEIPIPIRVEAAGYASQELLLTPASDLSREVRLSARGRPRDPAREPTEVAPQERQTATTPEDLMGNPYRKSQ